MKKSYSRLFFTGIAMSAMICSAHAEDLTLKAYTLDNPDNIPAPVHPIPHPRQIKWQETEFYAFFHYGMNTYTNLEWGNGSESNDRFAPTALPNPRQWLETIKKGGMNGGIAVVKHHDGFCLWPTETTDHKCTSSSNQYAKQTNIPRDFAAAAKELGLKYGFYVSPWDRNSRYWGDGTSDYVNKVFIPQCEELAQYGDDQFEMWFDGATGDSGYYGGANESRTVDPETYYDIPNLRDKIHKICPDMVMWGVGGEARWIGNESGWAGETCWSMGTGETGDENGWQWLPGESDAKATTAGWFWHSNESVQSLDKLWQFYLETVGRNATLILNFPPDKSGSLPAATVSRIEEFGQRLTERLGTDLALNANISASATRRSGASRNYEASNMLDGDKDTYWATDDDTNTASITLTWDTPQNIHYVVMQEYITLGQRVKGFTVEYSTDGTNFTSAAPGVTTTTIGYKRIIPLNGSTTNYGNGYNCKAIRINITDSKSCPLLHTISCY